MVEVVVLVPEGQLQLVLLSAGPSASSTTPVRRIPYSVVRSDSGITIRRRPGKA